MKKLFTTRRRVLIVGGAVTVMALAGGGAAYAYFTTSGSGTGTGAVGTSTNFKVTVAAPTGGPLYPGSGTETFSYTVNNPSSGNQLLNTVTISAAPSSAAATAGCLASWYSINGGTDSATINVGTDLAGGATTAAQTFTLTLTDQNANQDACENDAPVVTVTASS